MRRGTWVGVLGLLGCGPGAFGEDDTVGDEASESSSSESSSSDESSSDESSSDESSSDESSSDESSSDESSSDGETDTTTGDPCPESLGGMIEITDASDLPMFACLVEAQWVYVTGSFTDLGFLSTLEKVSTLHVENTPALGSLAGLDSLQEIGILYIFDAPSMVDLAGLSADVQIDKLVLGGGNDALISMAMPPGGASHLEFSGWDRPNLEILATASVPPTWISVRYTPLLEDLEDIAACCLDQQAQLGLVVEATPLLTHLQGLEAFTNLSTFWLVYNPNVESLLGLQNLEVVSELRITNDCWPDDDAKLVDLTGLEQLVEVGTLEIEGQNALVSLAGLPTQVAVDYAAFSYNPNLQQALIDAWVMAAMPGGSGGCDNLNGPPCEGICPQ